MARYTGAVCRLCRRERMKLFLKGAKCDTMQCPIERRPYPPGQHGRGRIRDSEYLLQLREKQKARRIYGLLEKQFRNLYAEATRQKGITGENLLRMLELRLDNVVFRAGFASSRNQARQFVRHGHVLGQRQARHDPVVHGAQGRRRRAARQGAEDDRAPPQHRHARPRGAAVARGHADRAQGDGARSARCVSRSTSRCASSSSSSSTPSNRNFPQPPRNREALPMLIIQRPEIEAGEAEGNIQRFIISPLEPGFGHTLGNSLRRTLLSSIPGAAVTQVRFDDALHEFDVIKGVKEDVTDLILNLKDLVLRCVVRGAGHPAPRQARPRRGHRRRHPDHGRRRDPQPRAPHRDGERQGPPRPRPHRRAGSRLPVGRAQQAHDDRSA